MTSTPDDDLDRRDMVRLVGGDDDGLNSLMDRYADRLFHYLMRILNDEADAADAAQECFVRVYRHRTEFDDRRRFSTWLYAIATNLARDRLRWRSRHPAVSLDAESPASGGSLRNSLAHPGGNPGETLEAEERGELVRTAINELPADLRLPLLLAEYEEQSHAEIGAILKCTAKAVEMRIYRARHELRRRLAPLLA